MKGERTSDDRRPRTLRPTLVEFEESPITLESRGTASGVEISPESACEH
jgi:hypothetical protein